MRPNIPTMKDALESGYKLMAHLLDLYEPCVRDTIVEGGRGKSAESALALAFLIDYHTEVLNGLRAVANITPRARVSYALLPEVEQYRARNNP